MRQQKQKQLRRATRVVGRPQQSEKLTNTIFALACAICSAAEAQDASPATTAIDTNKPVRLEDIVVQGREDSMIGIADSATQGTVGAKQLANRPVLRSGEILETVPGVIITQHAGGGKANQYFLRGFNLDHGTDFYTELDGMPINLPTHGHGQGYTDMNIVIPEFVQRVNYEKGVYYASKGDFASAGAAHLETFRVLPRSFVTLEGGMYGYGRAVFGTSPKLGHGNLLIGGEAYHHDGPWENPDDYQKFNGLLSYSMGDAARGYSVTARGYHGTWDSSDQVASSAIRRHLIDFYDSLDDTTGGDSQRYSVQGEWHRSDDASATKVMAYGFYYDLDLFSNFTYFLDDPVNGDQFEQQDRRWAAGLQASHTMFGQLGDRRMENTIGFQSRHDVIRNGLFKTRRQDRLSTTREDDILQNSAGIYFENKIRWGEKFRTVAGVRGDLYNFDVDSNLDANDGTRQDAIADPKLSLIFGPWEKTEVYLQSGLGHHSNDGRGVNTRIDPAAPPGTNRVSRADPLVQTYGAEIGARTTYIEGLQSSLSLWWLDIDSELLFVGDAGATEASQPSRRYGVEFANYYQVNKWFTLDADFSFSHSEFRDNPRDPLTGQHIGQHVPGSIESVIAAGITYHSDGGFFGSLRLRYFGPRPLIEDDSERSGSTIMLNAQVGYQINKMWTITAEVLNLLDRRDHDIDYFYESRVTPSDGVRPEKHFHPVEPIQARIALTARF